MNTAVIRYRIPGLGTTSRLLIFGAFGLGGILLQIFGAVRHCDRYAAPSAAALSFIRKALDQQAKGHRRGRLAARQRHRTGPHRRRVQRHQTYTATAGTAPASASPLRYCLPFWPSPSEARSPCRDFSPRTRSSCCGPRSTFSRYGSGSPGNSRWSCAPYRPRVRYPCRRTSSARPICGSTAMSRACGYPRTRGSCSNPARNPTTSWECSCR